MKRHGPRRPNRSQPRSKRKPALCNLQQELDFHRLPIAFRPECQIPAHRSSTDCTLANRPLSAARKAACTPSAGTAMPPNERDLVAQASCAREHSNPRSAAARTVESMHIWVIMPAITRRVILLSRRCSSRGVSRKLFGKFLRMMVSASLPGPRPPRCPSVPWRRLENSRSECRQSIVPYS